MKLKYVLTSFLLAWIVYQTGFLLKILHFPGANNTLIAAQVLLLFSGLIGIYKLISLGVNTDPKSLKGHLLGLSKIKYPLVLMLAAWMITSTGKLFLIMHWPVNFIVSAIGMVLGVLSAIVGIGILLANKEEEDLFNL